MRNGIEVFRNEKFGAIRTVEISDEIWFVGKDVATALGYSNPRDAISKHVDEDDKNTVAIRDGKGNPNQTIINESGLYSLILSSKLESAKEFKHWIIDKVIMATHNEDRSLVEPFSFQLSDVDCFEQSGTLYFKMADVAKCLDYSSPDNWNDWLDSDEILFRKINGIKKPMKYISESALYRILAKVNVPKAKPFERWVTKEVIPSIRKTGSYTAPSISKEEIEAKDKELRIGMYDRLHALANKYEPKNESYSQILDAYATKELTGEFLLPLPETEKTYSAGEIGQLLGISANKVGKIANANNLKTERYGKFFVDKSRYSSKEVETFRYNEDGMAEIKRLFREAT